MEHLEPLGSLRFVTSVWDPKTAACHGGGGVAAPVPRINRKGFIVAQWNGPEETTRRPGPGSLVENLVVKTGPGMCLTPVLGLPSQN